MKVFITILLCLYSALLPHSPGKAAEPPTYPVFPSSDTSSIRAKEGQKITVTGSVSDVKQSKSGIQFIHFKDSEFYLVTFKSDLPAFGDSRPMDLYTGKHLVVTGVVSIYKNKPQMKLNHPDMVTIRSGIAVTADPEKVKKREAANHKPIVQAPKKTAPDKKTKAPPVDPKKYFK